MRAVCRSVPARPENTSGCLSSVFRFAGRLYVYGVGRGQGRGGPREGQAGWEIPGTWRAARGRCSGSGVPTVSLHLAACYGPATCCNCCAAGRRGAALDWAAAQRGERALGRGPPVQSFTHSPSYPQNTMGSRALELSRTLIIWIIWHQPRRRAAGHSLPGVV